MQEQGGHPDWKPCYTDSDAKGRKSSQEKKRRKERWNLLRSSEANLNMVK